ncbi:MAG: extracellular solute-binding protein [Planctomycetes bacterium]|nr:extracellular solute-binding protein [Planctomycetota bacterium]
MIRRAFGLSALLPLLAACGHEDVTLYCALDQEHSEQLVRAYEKAAGVTVDANFDTESSKTVGLVSAIIEEAQRPRCDVFWNNELAQTVRLAQKGLLQPYVSPAAAGIPAQFKDPNGLWTGFAARARVLIVNTKQLGEDPAAWPKSIWDLTDPKWRGRCAIALPLTGTTLTHFVALRTVLGEERFHEWLDGLERNDVRFLQSNGATMKTTADPDNEIAFAFTDTDDFHVALSKGLPVACVFPDQQDGGIGTMLIPNSVGIVKGCPHLEQAKQLVDYIVSEQVEALLAAAKSAQIPLRATVEGPKSEWILPIDRFRPMVWDPVRVAELLESSTEEFAQRYGARK